jgi:hypothetical protein
MKFRDQRLLWRIWVSGIAILILALGSWVCFKDAPRVLNFGSHKQDQKLRPPAHDALAPAQFDDRLEVRRYFMDFDGDHSLDVATVTEQPFGGYAKYTVHLHLASGVEQSINLTAPRGGLQLEMHDMTGDNIPNDLILRPALLQSLPTVLLNDGHDHFAVAISAPSSGSVSCGQELSPRQGDDQGIVALLTTGFKTGDLMNGGGLFLPQVQEKLFSAATKVISQSLDYSFLSGRAPPAIAIPA